METIALVSLITALGYYLQDKTPRTKEGVRNISEADPEVTKMSELEKPNSLNIYNADKVNAANDEVLQRSLNNYKNAENPAITGILPPIYNSYSSIGNDTMLTVDFKTSSSKQLSEMNDLNRRSNVLEKPMRQVSERPMFNPSELGTGSKEGEFSNFGNGKLISQNISLLTGQPIQRDHSNMVPFFGSNVTQNIETFTNESKLDNLTGNTSTFFHKSEPLPRFEQVTQDIYGTPLVTDHIDTSRFIASAFRQGEKPFYEERVAAPISGTVNNPVDQNFQPTIDTLRTANKQQISYEGRTKAGQMGSVRAATTPVMKNRPDTHFVLGEDRFFKSTGAFVANKSTNNYENMPHTSRQDQNLEYYGAAVHKESLASMQRIKGIDNTDQLDFSSVIQPSKRVQLSSDTTRNISSQIPGINDYGRSALNLPELERETTHEGQTLNINKSSSGHKMGVQDDVKRTNKEVYLGKHDNTGNVRSTFINKDKNTGYTDYTTKPTQKETLVHNKYKGQANKKDGMGYVVAKYEAKTTNKELTSDIEYGGNANNINKNSMVRSTYEDPEKVRNAVHVEDYRGSGSHHTSAAANRQQYLNAEINEKKEVLVKGTRPSGPKSTLGSISSGVSGLGEIKLTQNMLLKERSKDRVENVHNQNVIPSKENIGYQQEIYNRFGEVENNRIDGNLATEQLSQNPFYNLR